jgi:hypothetical protein
MIIIFVILILTLLQGVRINSLSLPFVEVTQLYIKLDKKLIVSIKDLKIKAKHETSSSYEELQNYIDLLPIVETLFDSISIQKIHYENDVARILFKNSLFYVDTKYLSIDSSVKNLSNNILFEIKELIFKDFDIEFQGSLEVNLGKNSYDFFGNYESKGINGNAKLRIIDNELFYRISSKPTHSIAFFMDYLNTKVSIEPEVSDWIYKNIVATEYKIEYLEGKINLKTFDYFPKSMRGKAIAKNATITFNQEAPPAFAEEVTVLLSDDTLSFKLKNGSYQQKPIENSKVYIYNLLTTDTGIVVELDSNLLLDNEIQKILKAFNINIPLIQKQGLNASKLKLDIDFIPVHVKEYSGIFKFENSHALLGGLEVFSKSGTILMENENLTFKNVHLQHKDLFSIYIDGILNTQKKEFKGKTNIEFIDINLKDKKLLHVKNFLSNTLFFIHQNSIQINLLDLDTNLSFLENGAHFEIKSIQSLKPFSELLEELQIKQATASIRTKDYQTFNSTIKVKELESMLYEKNGTNIQNLTLEVQNDSKKFHLKDKTDRIKASFEKDFKLELENIDIKTDFSKTSSSLDFNIFVKGKNSTIFDTNSSLSILNDNFSLEQKGDEINFESSYKKGTLKFLSSKEKIFLDANNLGDKYVNALLGKNIFYEGEISLFLDGKSKKDFQGVFFLHEGTLKDLKFFNNIMAFINTIPALATFKSPKFNDNGYEIQDGYISFIRKQNTLTFDEIKLKGHSADISGKGSLTLETNKLDMKLQISTLKDISNAINNIPIIKDILLGEGGRIYTNLSVKGTLDKPEIATHILEDTVLTPVNIIKRALQLPFK